MPLKANHVGARIASMATLSGSSREGWPRSFITASRKAANEMVSGYGIVYAPALTSRHSEGKAVDMNISWTGDLTITKADKTSITIKVNPKTGDNADLQAAGATYGVIKLATDPPHWSSDGH